MTPDRRKIFVNAQPKLWGICVAKDFFRQFRLRMSYNRLEDTIILEIQGHVPVQVKITFPGNNFITIYKMASQNTKFSYVLFLSIGKQTIIILKICLNSDTLYQHSVTNLPVRVTTYTIENSKMSLHP